MTEDRVRSLALLVGLGFIGLQAACAGPLVPIAIGAGGAAGAFAAVQALNQDTDIVLAIAKPINQALCVVEKGRAHGPSVTAAITTFCNHLPDDPVQLLEQAALVINSIQTEQAEARQPHG